MRENSTSMPRSNREQESMNTQGIDCLTEKERERRQNLISQSRKFASDPEFAICGKVGIGACWQS